MIIKVRVHPHSNEEEVKRISDKDYEIHVKEIAENSKANKRIVNLLAKEFHVSYKDVKIINKKNRVKLIKIREDNKKIKNIIK